MSGAGSRGRPPSPRLATVVSIALALCLSGPAAYAQKAQGEIPLKLSARDNSSSLASSAPELAKAPTISRWGYDFAVTALLAEPFEGGRSVGDWGYGVLLLGGAHFGDIPLSAGFNVSGIRWGQASSVFDVQLGDRSQRLEETRTDQTVIVGSWLRLEPSDWRVRPYLEGLLGLKLLNTRYSFALLDGMGSTSAVTDQAVASDAGVGVGFDAQLAQASDGSEAAVFATLGVRRLWGSRASFTRAPDSSSVNRAVSFNVATDTTIISLGIAVHGRVSKP